jgi:hypothetical protein
MKIWGGIVGGVAVIFAILSLAFLPSAAAPPDEPEGPKITPVAMTDGERTYWGLGMSWRW